MNSTLLVFPNQLFRNHRGFEFDPDKIALIEDSLFFLDWQYPVNLHKQKLIYHRASMKAYESYLLGKHYDTIYVDWQRDALKYFLESSRPQKLIVMDPVDRELNRRIGRYAKNSGHTIHWIESQLFINTTKENTRYSENNKRWFMASFYKHQRKRLNILIDNKEEPVGGKWSYDSDNRKKIPRNQHGRIPALEIPESGDFVRLAKRYVSERFPHAIGSDDDFYYPVTHAQAKHWLQNFLNSRFEKFGPYQDALVPGENWLYHSVLSPLLNTGLLCANDAVSAAIIHAEKQQIPISSLEGFIRQIIGWREFMRATYMELGTRMRTTNSWQHRMRMPASFYTASTAITPIDDVIGRLIKTGYCHHIERLMVIGGFMFLCEIDPDDIYTWFMAFFIDAYDWVMVPNVYAMSQNADGGLITTKPYFSGSAYLKKMGYSEKGEWCQIWDGLYWRWIWKNRNRLSSNPRWAMMCRMVEKMDKSKLNSHLNAADNYLKTLFSSPAAH